MAGEHNERFHEGGHIGSEAVKNGRLRSAPRRHRRIALSMPPSDRPVPLPRERDLTRNPRAHCAAF